MPLPPITDLESFNKITNNPRQIAGLYFYQVLDCLVDLAYKVSGDFRKRPQLYRDLGQPSIAELLAQLNAKYGTETNFLSGSERDEIYLPIFGSWNSPLLNGTSSFSRLSNDLIRAATAFVQGASDVGLSIFRENVRTSITPFADYLLGLHGDSIVFSRVALSDLTEKVVYTILRSQKLGAIFGVSNLVSKDYPYATDANGDLLVEQISGELTWQVNNTPPVLLTREIISKRQRVALKGAEALAEVVDFSNKPNANDADLDRLISKCYIWGTALASLSSQVPSPPRNTQPTPAASPMGASAYSQH